MAGKAKRSPSPRAKSRSPRSKSPSHAKPTRSKSPASRSKSPSKSNKVASKVAVKKEKNVARKTEYTVAEQATAIVGNVASSVSLILLNKALTEKYNFKYITTVTLCHMIFMSAAFFFASKINLFKAKSVPTNDVIKMALSGVGSIWFMNLSLSYNSVGVYQLSKLACIPCTVFVQTLWFGESFSTRVYLSLFAVMAGIVINIQGDLQFGDASKLYLGLPFAIAAVITTTLYQIWIGSKQKELGLDQFQMLYRVSPAMAVVFAVLAPITDGLFDVVPWFNLHTAPLVVQAVSNDVWLNILLSCIAAVGVNFSTYVLIRRTSVVTYLVVGHVKTILILLSGFVMFGAMITRQSVLSIIVSMSGILAYGYFKNQDAANKLKAK